MSAIPHCSSDLCGQDSRRCPTPFVCEVAQPDPTDDPSEFAEFCADMGKAGLIVLAFLLLCPLLYALGHWLMTLL